MNDEELITLVREQRDKASLTVPIEEIFRRGRMVRTRRRLRGGAGLTVAVAGVALAASALTPAATYNPGHNAGHQTAGHSASPTDNGELAGFTLTEQVDGTISVTISQLQDPSGLQSSLRADGVPASVAFAEQLNPACQTDPASTTLLESVFPTPYQSLPSTPPNTAVHASETPTPSSSGGNQVYKGETGNHDSTVVVINPSPIPSDAGVQLAVSSNGAAFLLPQLVYASSQCTGS